MFGKTLRQLRKQKGVTQAELAAILNLDASSISKYEKADVSPSADILLKIAQYFDVPTDYLLGLPDKQKAPNSNELDAIPGMKELDPGMKELEDVMSRLSDAGRETLLQQARALQSLEQSLKDQK